MAEGDFNIRITADATSALSAAKETAQALKDIQSSVIQVGQKDVDAAEKMAAAGNKAFASKAQLKAMVKGLAAEFPGLAHLAHLALNPITFVVAGIASAFALWTQRMQNAKEVLAGFEMPDVSEDKLKVIEKAVSAWEEFAKKVQATVDAYKSLQAASERNEKQIDKQADREKKRLDNQKKMELAVLEMNKGNMSDAEYAGRKASIEWSYEQGAMAIEERAQFRKLEEKARTQANLEIHAKAALDEADKLRPGSAEQESAIEERYKSAAEKAKKDYDAREERLNRLNAMHDSAAERAKFTPWFAMQYGVGVTGQEARDLESAGMAGDMDVIGSYRNFQRGQKTRSATRDRKSRLIDSAAKDAGDAYILGQEMPGAINDYNEQRGLNRETAAADQAGRLAGAISASGEENQRMAAEIDKWMRSAGAIPQIVTEHTMQVTRAIEAMKRQLSEEQDRMWKAVQDGQRR